MARNRKNQPAGLTFGVVAKAFLLCLFIVSCCVGYVWQKKQITELSQQISKNETRLDLLRNNNAKLKKQLAALMTPPALDARVKELRLGLALPQQNKIWRLPEPAPEPEPVQREQQYAADQTRAEAVP
jgi:cell division protein FtsB